MGNFPTKFNYLKRVLHIADTHFLEGWEHNTEESKEVDRLIFASKTFHSLS